MTSREELLEQIAAKAREWAGHYSPHSDGQNTFVLFAEWVESLPVPAQGKREPSAEDIARTICLSYGRDPDEMTSMLEMCDANNRAVPIWRVYEEQAEAILAASPIPSAHRAPDEDCSCVGAVIDSHDSSCPYAHPSRDRRLPRDLIDREPDHGQYASSMTSTGLPAPAPHEEVREATIEECAAEANGIEPDILAGMNERDTSVYCRSRTDAVSAIRALALPQSTKSGDIEPHIYSPDYQAMGDCRVCGHVEDKPWHLFASAGRGGK